MPIATLLNRDDRLDDRALNRVQHLNEQENIASMPGRNKQAMLMVTLKRLVTVAGKLRLGVRCCWIGMATGIDSLHIDDFAVLRTNGVPGR